MAYTTMNELMQNYRALMAEKNWTAAHEVLLHGVDCAHIPAKLELARLYKDCTLLGIPQQERFGKAEMLYRGILNLDLSDKDTGIICVEVAELYSYMKRYVGMMAMLLQAKRFGVDVPERDVDQARKILLNLDIREYGRSARDAYDLANELIMAGGSERLTELLLREATESNNKLIRGKAALALADFYNDQRSENHIYADEANRYYRMAAEAGYPEYLSRRNTV